MYLAKNQFQRLKLENSYEPFLTLGYTPIDRDETNTVLFFKRFGRTDATSSLLTINFDKRGELINSIMLNLPTLLVLLSFGVHHDLEHLQSPEFYDRMTLELIAKQKNVNALSFYRKQGYKTYFAQSIPYILDAKKNQISVLLYRVFNGLLYLKTVSYVGGDIIKDDEIIISKDRARAFLNAVASTEEVIETHPEVYLTPEQREEKRLLSENDWLIGEVLGEIDKSWLDEEGNPSEEYIIRQARTQMWLDGILSNYEDYLKQTGVKEDSERVRAYLGEFVRLAAQNAEKAVIKEDERVTKLEQERKEEN